jgi:signal transduction histidine kinase
MKKRKDKEYNDQEVIVSVKDTGDGIHPEILHRLFTKFATKSETGGTGLGLFISKSIVESHGGKMWAANNKTGNSNNRENRGATFSFTLPLATNKIQYNTNQEVNSKERQLAKEID